MTLPANQLELALFLEADRMRGLEITPDGINAARTSVLEERARATGSGYATARFRFNSLAFDNFANQQSGAERFPAKVNAVTAGETQALAQKYFVPDRAQIAAVGDASKIRGALEKLGKVEA